MLGSFLWGPDHLQVWAQVFHQSSVSHLWPLRAVVLKRDGALAKVYYLDYGNSESLSLGSIFTMPPNQLATQMLSIRCRWVQWNDDDYDDESDVDGMLMMFEIEISSWSKPFQCAPVAGPEREWWIKSQGTPWDIYLASSELQVVLHVGLITFWVWESSWLTWCFTCGNLRSNWKLLNLIC